MKVITKTDEYTIYQKRSERYAIKNAQRHWINGDEKVAILLKHKLVAQAKGKSPEAEPAEEASAEDATETAAAETAAAETAPAETAAAEPAAKESDDEAFTPDADATR